MKTSSVIVLMVATVSVHQAESLEYSEIVELPAGKIRGAQHHWRGRTAYEFKGVPFAAPPTRELRFAKPVNAQTWEEVRNATAYGKSCPQSSFATKAKDQDEDCLYMNIYVNKETFDDRDKQLKPVLFWIHGGGFMSGSGNEHDGYKGVPLVILEDVILVTFNYRLGSFGFLSFKEIPSLVPNLGLWDQHKALEWVHLNIHLFGGDPDRVTIFGQSAGSASVASQILSPESKGLFRGAIMESGGIMNDLGHQENTSRVMNEMLESVDCSVATDKLECLRSVPWRTLLANTPRTFLAPVFGDEFLPRNAEEAIASRNFNDVNLLIGAERDEGDFLVCGTYKFGALKASKSVRSTYGYIHTQAPIKPWGLPPLNDSVFPDFKCGRESGKTCHCDDMIYIFGAPVLDSVTYDADDVELSLNMMKIWADFARAGKPSNQGPVEWPLMKSTSDKLNLIELNNSFLGKVDDVTATECVSA